MDLKKSFQWMIILVFVVSFLVACSGQIVSTPASSTSIPSTPTPKLPSVTFGYIETSPVAIVQPEAGLSIAIFDITYQIKGGFRGLASYKERVSYPSGEITELEFYDIDGEDGYTVSMNGDVLKGPTKAEFESNRSGVEGIGFAPGGELPIPFIQLPCSGGIDSSVEYDYAIAEGVQVRQVARHKLVCDNPQKTYNLQFSDQAYGIQEGVLTLTEFKIQVEMLPSATPAPIMLTPKPGQWQGEGVTIKVSTNGTIELIELWVEYSGGFCAIGGKDMIIQADGTFAFSLDDPNYSYQISGKFDSPTTVSITYDLKKYAGNENTLEPQTLTAEWRGNISDMPTLLPPTVVPTLTPPLGPRAGHWEGKGSFGVYVWFDVTANGDIRNFVIDIPIGTSTCTMRLEEIIIESDGTFIYSEKLETGSETNRISGTFESATTLTGIVGPSILCGGMATGFSNELTWNAEWKNPGTAVATVTAEAMSTTAPIAGATPMVSDVLLYDDFGSNVNDWWVGKSSKENSDKAAEIANGKYRYSVTSQKGTFRWNSLPNFTVKDFLLSVDATLVEASGGQPGGTQVGFNFRVNDNEDYYRLAIYDDNHFKVNLRKEEKWQTLYAKTASSAINLAPGVVNTFAILAEGSTFTFYANGQELVTVTDTTLSEPGKIGLGVELDESGQTATVEFDNLVIKAVP